MKEAGKTIQCRVNYPKKQNQMDIDAASNLKSIISGIGKRYLTAFKIYYADKRDILKNMLSFNRN